MLTPAIPKKVMCLDCEKIFETVKEIIECPLCKSTSKDTLSILDAEYDASLAEVISDSEYGEGD